MRELNSGCRFTGYAAAFMATHRGSRLGALAALVVVSVAAASKGAILPDGDQVAEAETAQQPHLPAPAWATPIIDPMRRAETTLVRGDLSGVASQSQRAAVARIDEALSQLQKQCRQCAGKCSGGATPKPSNAKPGTKPGNKPGNQSGIASAPNSAAPRALGPEAASALVEELWGHLPERQRQQMLQPLSEQFLPKYSADIEAYFRGLAEPTSAEDAQ